MEGVSDTIRVENNVSRIECCRKENDMGEMKADGDKKCMVNIGNGKKSMVRIVSSTNQKGAISSQDALMDERATEAVKSAIAKAEFCKKPIARYDTVKKKAYIEYADGARKYVE